MTFKVWDKVRCIEWVWEYLTKWKIYTIIKINDQEFPRVVDDDWDDNWFSKDKFELVQEDKLPHELIWLPRFFAVKKDESDPLWRQYCDWCDLQDKKWTNHSQDTRYDDWGSYIYIGYDDVNYAWWYRWSDNLVDDFKNNPTLITLAERDRIVNKKPTYDDYCDWVEEEQRKSQTKQLSEKYTYTNQVLRSDWVLFTPDEIWGEKVSDIKDRYNRDRSLLRKHKDLFGN